MCLTRMQTWGLGAVLLQTLNFHQSGNRLRGVVSTIAALKMATYASSQEAIEFLQLRRQQERFHENYL